MANTSKKSKFVAASIAGLLAAGSLLVQTQSAQAEMGSKEGMEACYGINACKGMGECGGKGHSCAGMNECKGVGSLNVPQGTCMKIQGGSLTAA